MMSDVIQILEQLVKYDTRTWSNTPAKEVKQLYEEMIIPRLKENGFEVEIIESNGHYSIFAEKRGKTPKILYSGHVDVVPWDDNWDYDPRQLEIQEHQGEDVVIGRGVSDMKSGIAAMLAALPKLSETDTHLQFAITGDEEIAGENGTKVIVSKLNEENNLPDYVITADAAGMEIITRRRNVFNITLKAKNSPKKIKGIRKQKVFKTNITSSNTSHAAYYKRKEDKHCIKLAAEFIEQNEYYPINVEGSFVSTNVIPNDVIIDYVIPDENGDEILVDEGLFHLFRFIRRIMDIEFETEAYSDYGINSTVNLINSKDSLWEVVVDIRAMISYNNDILETTVKQIIKETGWNFELDIFKSIGFIATGDNHPLVKSTTGILSDLGYPDEPAERGGATDGRFFAKYDIPTIDIGAIGFNVHGPNETATIQSIKDLVKFFQRSSHEVVKAIRNT